MSKPARLIINRLLSNSQSQIQQAVTCSQEAPYTPSFSAADDSSSSSSWFGGSSSGGGSFSSGSGSEGSY